MSQIWKFPLEFDTGESLEVKMPAGATILSIHLQNDVTTIWAIVEPHSKLTTRTFIRVLTGQEFTRKPPRCVCGYIGTVLHNDGEYVEHIFELVKL